MKEDEFIDKIYLNKEEIINIINQIKQFSFDDYLKPNHYELSLLTKGTDELQLKKIYPQFELIKLITLRKRKSGYNNYDIYYELKPKNFALFSIHFEDKAKNQQWNNHL